MILFISGSEIFIVIVVAVMLFGADKIPEMAKGISKGMRQLKDATDDIKREVINSAEKQGIDKDFTSGIEAEIKKAKKDIDDLTGPIKRSF